MLECLRGHNIVRIADDLDRIRFEHADEVPDDEGADRRRDAGDYAAFAIDRLRGRAINRRPALCELQRPFVVRNWCEVNFLRVTPLEFARGFAYVLDTGDNRDAIEGLEIPGPEADRV